MGKLRDVARRLRRKSVVQGPIPGAENSQLRYRGGVDEPKEEPLHVESRQGMGLCVSEAVHRR